jgi:hypothetical protein
VVPNGEQPEWLNAAGELVRRVSCDASMQVGAAVESVEDVSRLLELAYSSVRGWHPGGRVLLWDDAFGVVVGAWSAEIAADVCAATFESWWSDIRRGRDGLNEESNLHRFASRCFLYGQAIAALGAVQVAVGRRLAERRHPADNGSVGVSPATRR